MKYLVLLLVVVLVLWLAGRPRVPGGRRAQSERQPSRETPANGSPRPMVVCAQCGVHLPADEALPGPGGHYCCEAHRASQR
ncbi:hypothetical protein M8A51_04095 [Schlegelella sp. S2-27]|uniref:Preprotein translocase subunit YajC n=1 Tax=Caldimonas mangrovi TaxID=2944811 RepID=A0ABT0YJ02_9BURK|nr:PP0621 family protein [Caldimonas mangrovi]MCM5678711.1 hypothetical protein [Caldimonas mangrovi]